MKLPKYLIADNSKTEDEIYVVHTEFPRFIINMNNDEIEWFDSFSEQEAQENADIIEEVVKQAYNFFDDEIKNY